VVKLVSKKIERMAREHGFADFKWINPRDVVTGNWVRMKCQFGCDGYGKGGCCPPEVPSVTDCRRFFDEYKVGLLLTVQSNSRILCCDADGAKRHRRKLWLLKEESS